MKFLQAEDDRTEINLTPLIDVVFLLLIFFMVTTTFNQYAKLRIDLPEAEAAADMQPKKKVEVLIDKNGNYFIGDQSLVDNQPRTLLNALSKAMETAEEKAITIRADAQAQHQAVVSVMDAAAKLDIIQVSIATSKSE